MENWTQKNAGLVVFRLDRQRYALPLNSVERIVRAVAVTLLPTAPAVVLGVVNVAGQVVPVFDIRRRFHLQEQPITPAHQLIIVHTAQRTAAFIVDQADGVIGYPATAIVDARAIAPGLEHLHGVVKLDDGLVLIHDPDAFLSMEESQALNAALVGEDLHAD